MNGKILKGSICITDLLTYLKKGHSAFTKGKNEKLYANIVLFLNDQPDQYNNSLSMQLSSTQELKAKDLALNNGKPVYMGNAKYSKKDQPKPINQSDIKSALDGFDDDLPNFNNDDDIPEVFR
jgi:hypothetical protein